MKIKNIVELFTILPEEERIITDVLRQIILETLPGYCKEKFHLMFPSFMEIKAFALYGLPPFPGAA